MKKILFFFATVLITSCSHDDDGDTKESYYNGPRYMDPPAWIQGVWKDDHDRFLKFTENDLLYKYPLLNYVSTSNEIVDYENYYWDKYEQYQNPNVQEVELIDYYSIKYNALDIPSKKFIFKRISDTEIESTGIMPGIYIKQ